LEDEQIMGDFRGREGDVIAGVIQQSSDPRNVLVDFGTIEGILPQAEQVPEIADGTVLIAALAREAGHRTKIAVHSTVPGVNAKGACIGPMGQRVRAVMSELHGEKIDIIDYSDDPAQFV